MEGGREAAPDVHGTCHPFARFLGEHARQPGSILLEPYHAIAYEGIILHVWLVEPVDIGHVEPALLAKMLFDLANLAGEHGLVLGRLLAEAAKARLAAFEERTAAHALDRHAEAGEVVRFDCRGHGPIKSPEIDLGPGRLRVGEEPHLEMVQWRRIGTC